MLIAACTSINELPINYSELEGNWIYHTKIGDAYTKTTIKFSGKDVKFKKEGETIPLKVDKEGFLIAKTIDGIDFKFAELRRVNRNLYLICGSGFKNENCDFATRED